MTNKLVAMNGSKSILERAFEVARSGKVTNVAELRIVLHREGYTVSQIEGRTLVGQLRGLIEQAGTRAAGHDPGAETADDD
jgi:hypothetical protein